MRPLEMLLVLVNGLALLVVAAPALRASRWTRYAAFIPPAIACAQVLVEGSRWQMVQAYALSAVLFLILLLHRREPSREATRRGGIDGAALVFRGGES